MVRREDTQDTGVCSWPGTLFSQHGKNVRSTQGRLAARQGRVGGGRIAPITQSHGRKEHGRKLWPTPPEVARVSPVPIDHSDLVADLLKELSNHNERVEERKGALLELLKITREDSLGVWEEHFKTILLLLLETLGDKDVSTLTAPSA